MCKKILVEKLDRVWVYYYSGCRCGECKPTDIYFVGYDGGTEVFHSGGYEDAGAAHEEAAGFVKEYLLQLQTKGYYND